MAYLLDANVFMQAKNLHYGFDFCPAFWDWLIDNNSKNKVYSISKVADEIEAGQDDLSDWAKERGSEFFLEPDEGIFPAFGKVSEWANSGFYEQSAISTFFQVADYHLVAFALANGHTVVTHEVAANTVKKIKYQMRASV